MDPRTAKTKLFATDGISWIGLFAGPLAWAADEAIGYALADWSCRAGHHAMTHALSAAALALIAAGIVLAWRDWRRQNAGDSANRAPARARFLALNGFLLCLLFGAVVLLDTAAKFYFGPCQR